MRPNGLARVPDLERAGGARALMARLGDHLETSALTVTGRPMSANLEGVVVRSTTVIRTLDDPVAPNGGLDVLRGNLAPAGAVVKVAATGARRRFRGPARLYESEEAAIAALSDGLIVSGYVVVLRGLGPVGGPGTVFAAGFVAALTGAGLSGDVAVVTDGELSGLNSGFVVGQIMPEAAAGGPLAAVHESDTIVIDLDARRVDLCDGEAAISDDEIARRLRDSPPDLAPAPRGWLAIYRENVQPIETTGATLLP